MLPFARLAVFSPAVVVLSVFGVADSLAVFRPSGLCAVRSDGWCEPSRHPECGNNNEPSPLPVRSLDRPMLMKQSVDSGSSRSLRSNRCMKPTLKRAGRAFHIWALRISLLLNLYAATTAGVACTCSADDLAVANSPPRPIVCE